MDVLGLIKSKLGVKKPQEKPTPSTGYGVASARLKNKLINKSEKPQLVQLEAEEFEASRKAASKSGQGYNY